MVDRLLIKNAAQIVTPEGKSARHGREMKQLKIYENQSILIENGKIRSIGNQPDWEKLVPADKQIDASGKAVLPGFVDSHTHLVFGGYRPDEFLWRMGGMSYMEIMERGGGILNTMKATREASREELVDHSMDFLKKMLAMGVTTVEAKSGYGQDHDTEIKQMEVVRDLNEKQPIELVSTFLGAHAVPPEYKDRGDDFIEFLLKDVMPEDFIKFGLIPEFIGRVPVVVTLDALDENALISILKEPKNSLTKQYHRLFELDGVELDFEDDALELVAKKSLERKTGARGLRAIMEGSLMDLMYKIPSDDTIRKCTITKDVVDGTGEPEIVRGEAPAQAKTAGSRRTSRTHKKDKPETA